MTTKVFASAKAVRTVMNEVLQSFRTCSGSSYTEKTSDMCTSCRSIRMFVPYETQRQIRTEGVRRFAQLSKNWVRISPL